MLRSPHTSPMKVSVSTFDHLFAKKLNFSASKEIVFLLRLAPLVVEDASETIKLSIETKVFNATTSLQLKKERNEIVD